jgi:hypothetical protein
MEIEFLAQTGALLAGIGGGLRALDALSRLAALGWLSEAEAGDLAAALSLQARLQQVERAALEEDRIDPERIGAVLSRALASAAGFPDFETLGVELARRQARAAEIAADRFVRLLAEAGPEEAPQDGEAQDDQPRHGHVQAGRARDGEAQDGPARDEPARGERTGGAPGAT